MEIGSTQETNNDFCALLEKLINEKGNLKDIARIINVEIKEGASKGTNYGSIILKATLTVVLCNGHKSKVNLIIKRELMNEEVLKAINDIPVFKNETMFYNELVEKCEVLMDEYQDKNDKLWCDFICHRPYDLVILEDLSIKNFIVPERTIQADLNHASLVLHSLGRFHGLFHVLIQKGQLCKKDTSSYYAETDTNIVQTLYSGGLTVLSHVIENTWSPEWKEIAKRLNKEKDFITAKINKVFEIQENSFLTLCHGDCWTCNLMFKYCPYDENYPIAMKFLDYQGIHVNSYIFDIVHFLYSSVRHNVRRNNYNKLLTIYQKSLQSTLALYGMEERAPTLQQIQSDAERIEYYGFAVNLILPPIIIAEVKDPFNLEHFNDGCDPMDAFNPEIFKNEQYKCAVQPELKHWFEKGLF